MFQIGTKCELRITRQSELPLHVENSPYKMLHLFFKKDILLKSSKCRAAAEAPIKGRSCGNTKCQMILPTAHQRGGYRRVQSICNVQTDKENSQVRVFGDKHASRGYNSFPLQNKI